MADKKNISSAAGKVVKPKGKGLPRKEKILPAVLTPQRQPSIITLMDAKDYNLMHHRCVLVLVRCMQREINESIKKIKPEQMDLFRTNDEVLNFEIPLKDFDIPKNHYAEFKIAVASIATMPVILPIKHPQSGEPYYKVSGLFEVLIPQNKYARTITIEMKRDVALHFVNMEKGFTKYMYEVAMSTKSKYTLLFYTLCSHWRDRGGFKMKIENFRKHFGVQEKYLQYKDLYKRVIQVAYEELHRKADVWFEMQEIIKDGKNIKTLSFKVIKEILTPEEQRDLNLVLQNLERSLRNEFPKITSSDIKDVFSVINNTNYKLATDKAMQVMVYINDNLSQISHPLNYFIAAFKEKMIDYEVVDLDKLTGRVPVGSKYVQNFFANNG